MIGEQPGMSSIETGPCGGRSAPKPSVAEDDAELLRRFVSDHSEEAFEALMCRHGPMVMGVCRRVLKRCQDAEDAYQATFLLLVQKSASIHRPEQLASWLFGVAFRIASRVRARAAKQGSHLMEPADTFIEDSTLEVAGRELHSVLDEELHALPEKHRLPLILCILEGKSHLEAARQLGWPSGSMSARVAQAREKLRRRLTRRGLALSATLFALLLTRKATAAVVSPAIVEQTTRAAMLSIAGKARLAEVVSPSVIELLDQMNQRMLVARMKRLAAQSLVVVILLGTAANLAWMIRDSKQTSAPQRGHAFAPMFQWIAKSTRLTFHGLTEGLAGGRASLTHVQSTGHAESSTPEATSSCGAH